METENNISDKWTILKLLSWTDNYFKASNIDSPRFTAEILLCCALNIRRIDLYLQFDRPLNKSELAKYKTLIKRRIKKEPVAYITGNRGFWNLEFNVTPDVLIPRPDTELLVETALSLIKKKTAEINIKDKQNQLINNSDNMEIRQKKDQQNKKSLKILELGTGSGAIAISIIKEGLNFDLQNNLEKQSNFKTNDLIVFATDISPKAAVVAKSNNDCSKNLFLLVGSWFDPIKFGTKFDLIISNPPYIPTDGIKNLQQEVRDYEPRLALDGGYDGISCLRQIMQSAHKYLAKDGTLLMEIGFDQKDKVMSEAVNIKQYEPPVFIKDYAGHNRVVLLKHCY